MRSLKHHWNQFPLETKFFIVEKFSLDYSKFLGIFFFWWGGSFKNCYLNQWLFWKPKMVLLYGITLKRQFLESYF